jgi:putative flippase GtrA
MKKAFKYISFAILATITNIFFQYIVLKSIKEQYAIYIAILAGTLSGLILKYILDKNFIFFYETKNTLQNSKTFFIYSITGIITTLVFWLVELGFYFILKNEHAKYIGAIIGLSIGYFIKYFLDKKYVFKEKNAT